MPYYQAIVIVITYATCIVDTVSFGAHICEIPRYWDKNTVQVCKMAKVKHITTGSQQPTKTARFYQDVFDMAFVGKIEGDNAEGCYLSDGNINLAILRFKNETVAGEFGMKYEGLHHIGFQVEDLEDTGTKLRNANSLPMEDINAALKIEIANGRSRNVELKYEGPDGLMIDVSQHGWVGTDGV